MDHATLQIESIQGGLRCTWSPPSGEVISRTRCVNADDLAAAECALDHPPCSLSNLEGVGTRIFSRLLDREVRGAVFGHSRCALLIESDRPGVPWDIAFSDGRLLADVHAVGMAPAITIAPARGGLSVLLVADPTGDLPYSLGEAREIVDRLRSVGRARIDTLTGAAATRNAVLTALETTPYNVIHFSCHAEHCPDAPGRSFIGLFDGRVTASDLFQAAVIQPPTLCVLNACESGRVGAGHPVAGLSSAFRSAGAAAVIGARWKVNNKSSAFWMASFYAGLVSGDPIGIAALNARTETRRLFSNDSMLTWATFTLEGAPWTRILEGGTRVNLGRAPLVGRDEQWREMDDAWQAARAGRGAVLALIGPSGSGKTRLLNDWLSALPVACVHHFSASATYDAAEIVRWARQRGGGVLAVDSPDCDSQVALLALAEASKNEPLLLVLTARRADELMMPQGAVRVVGLTPLKGDCLAALFDSLGSTSPAGIREALPGEAERLALGLPRGGGAAVLSNGLPALERSVLRAGAVWGERFAPRQLAELLQTGLEDLWRPLESLCSSAWLIEEAPGSFRFRDTSDRDAILAAFSPAGERIVWERRAAGLCEASGDSGAAGLHWRAAREPGLAAAQFLDAFRTAATPAQALAWRVLLLETGMEPEDADHSAAVATALCAEGQCGEATDHWEHAAKRSAEPRQRAQYLLRCVRCATRAGLLERAENAVWMAESLGPPDDGSVELARVDILIVRGQAAEAEELARGVLENPSAMAEHRIHAAVGAANACLLKTEPNRAAVYCRRGLELDPVHQPLRRLLAQASQYAGDYGGAEATLSSLAEFERASGRPQEHAETLLALAQLRRDQGHLESAMRGARTAMDIGERCGQIAVVAESASVLSSILRRLGRYGEALEAAKSAHRAATEAGLASEAIRATIHIATALVEQGSLAAARESALYGTRQAERTGYLFGAAWVATIAGITQMEAGDTSSAAPLLEGALDVSERIHGHIGMASALHHLGWNAWLRGEAAEDAFIRAREVASRISYCAVQYPAAFGFALCSGDLEGSERALREIEALNMGAIVPWLREKRGAWLVKQGLWEDALRDLAPAYRVARRLGMRMLQARAAAGLADAYSGMGDSMAEAMRHEAEDLRAECVADW